jgi:hypothetical protein
MGNRPLFSPLDPNPVYYDLINQSEKTLILQLFNSPSEIISKIQEGSDIGWMEDEENSIFKTSFGNVQIIIRECVKNEIEINPISGETEDGWENLINYIHDEDRKMMTSIIEKFEDYSSMTSRELKYEEVDGWDGFQWDSSED